MSHIFLQVSLMLVTFLRFWIDGAPVEREEAQFGSTWSWHMWVPSTSSGFRICSLMWRVLWTPYLLPNSAEFCNQKGSAKRTQRAWDCTSEFHVTHCSWNHFKNGSKAKLKIAIKKEQKWPWVWVSMGILVSFLSNEWWTAPADLVPMVAASLRPALDVLDALDALGRTGLRWCNHGFVENRKVVILHVI